MFSWLCNWTARFLRPTAQQSSKLLPWLKPEQMQRNLISGCLAGAACVEEPLIANDYDLFMYKLWRRNACCLPSNSFSQTFFKSSTLPSMQIHYQMHSKAPEGVQTNMPLDLFAWCLGVAAWSECLLLLRRRGEKTAPGFALSGFNDITNRWRMTLRVCGASLSMANGGLCDGKGRLCEAIGGLVRQIIHEPDYTLTKWIQIMGKYNEFITL